MSERHKIIVVGGSGTIGKAVSALLAKRHEIIFASRSHGDIKVDITDSHSIEKMYQQVGKFHAVVSTAGWVHFGEFSEITEKNYAESLQNKLMGQINLVHKGMKHIDPNGSFTLTSGILSRDPIRYGVIASTVNGALESFVKAAAIELPHQIRINVISPSVLTESLPVYGDYFLGFNAVSAEQVALAYSKSVEGAQTGQVYRVD
jgi:NAD(P)-dependent dehydrogenase (short-subunit alcohol dehydrogenase family)